MNTGENIRNSILVLYKTYESVSKLMEQCKTIAEENGYIVSTDKFLRWKSDNHSDGWLLNSFILLFQKLSDQECDSENNWRDGPVYTLEIFLGSNAEPDTLPQLLVSKFEYADINQWTEGCSPKKHWIFYHPVHKEAGLFSESEAKIPNITVVLPNSEETSKKYWGIKRALTISFQLTDITSDNLTSSVFDTFNQLSEVE